MMLRFAQCVLCELLSGAELTLDAFVTLHWVFSFCINFLFYFVSFYFIVVVAVLGLSWLYVIVLKH